MDSADLGALLKEKMDAREYAAEIAPKTEVMKIREQLRRVGVEYL